MALIAAVYKPMSTYVVPEQQHIKEQDLCLSKALQAGAAGRTDAQLSTSAIGSASANDIIHSLLMCHHCSLQAGNTLRAKKCPHTPLACLPNNA